jgi:ABC-type multidrug transport system fused ATPase/permease subunit
MDLSDRLLYLVIGCAIGFTIGYIVRGLREIKEEVQELDEHVKRDRNDAGYMRFPIVADIALLVVVCLTVYAAFASQKASNAVQDNQRCSEEFLADTIAALNVRTEYTASQTEANVAVQKAQADFFLGIYEQPTNDEVELRLFSEYATALEEFVKTSEKTSNNFEENKYPTAEDFKKCLKKE